MSTDILRTSKTVEWYTPSVVLEPARRVLGSFDLDPASCEEANENVKANRYFTKKDNGLGLIWTGRVWLNPPYGKGAGNKSRQGMWACKLINEVKLGRVEAGLLLVNAMTDCMWFHHLWQYPIAFIKGRLHFIPQRGAGKKHSPTHGSVVVLVAQGEALRTYHERFVYEFGKIAHVVSALQHMP